MPGVYRFIELRVSRVQGFGFISLWGFGFIGVECLVSRDTLNPNSEP